MNNVCHSIKYVKAAKKYARGAIFLCISVSLSARTLMTIFSSYSINELVSYMKSNEGRLTICGSGYSQGGQTRARSATQINLQSINHIVAFDYEKKQITVQAGATWRQVQEYIDRYDLSIRVMQSYNDFTIGGSLGVNVHGRDLAGQMIHSIIGVTVLLADGSLVKASREDNADLFYAVIGGYGLLGIVIDAKLQLTDNVPIALVIDRLSKQEYRNFFERNIRNNQSIQLHNAVIYPHDFSVLVSQSWINTNRPLNTKKRLRDVPLLHAKELFLEQLVRRAPLLHSTRPTIEPMLHKGQQVVYRNYEMSHTVKSIEPLVDFLTTSILQEYFIPLDYFELFMTDLERIKKFYRINMMNISVRFVPKSEESFLSYAPIDSFAFVLYIDVLHLKFVFAKTEQWTQQLIDAALSYGGTYYLPYAPYATRDQFRRSYKRVDEFLAVKKKYDPNNRFVNMMWQKYMK